MNNIIDTNRAREREHTKGYEIYSSGKKVNLILGMFTFGERTGQSGQTKHSWSNEAFGIYFVNVFMPRKEDKEGESSI